MALEAWGGGALHFTHFSELNQQKVFRTCREDECVYVRLQRVWVCATRGTSGRNSERVWQTDGHSVELFPISLSLIPFWVLHPLPCHLSKVLPHLFFPLSSTPFPSSSSSVKPGLGSSLTVPPLIFSLSLPLFPSSATSLLIFCWRHQLENIKRFFSECHSGPCWHSTKDTEEIWGFVWGSKRGKLERKDWQIWPANQSESKLPGKHRLFFLFLFWYRVFL